ncbi:STAS domain-containing protein [Saccharothrix luteola]|uniref:STAS domain-containing protein n=1 Tax=Saccharothrix luteola TaxID=2893018 RepID=UPI001E3EAC35|nr:STAS domain-containing protein [Saccharothrix luteola]MCC8250417.1 STAS domain-containing protein [Saccharothrix luteola]
MAEPMGHPSPILDIRVTRAGDVLVVGVAGELDIDTIPEVRATIASGLVEHPSALVLDLSEVSFFSSAGLSLLLEVRSRVDTLAVVATGRAVLRPIQLTFLGPLLTVFDSVDDALASVASTRGVRRD